MGWNNISIGNNSRRPASISKIITYFDSIEKCPKFCVGPAIASPGPMLFIVAATDVNVVTKSLFSNERINTEIENKIVNVMKYTFVALSTV